MNQQTRLDAPLPFIDVAAQRRRLGTRIDDAIARVLGHCQFINGPEVRELERDLSAFCGAKHAIGVSSGTDALVLILMALGIGRGDAVLCPSFTFSATAESVALVGATPVFVDVLEATFNLDPASVARGIGTAQRLGLNPKAVMAVDMFGLPADYETIARIAQRHGLKVIEY
jgi:dTDP-4-amino-4,6-dideoxygalactose transaminase